MAKIKIEEVLIYFGRDVRHALRDAVTATSPDVSIDEHELFRMFTRILKGKSLEWEQVPDRFVRSQ